MTGSPMATAFLAMDLQCDYLQPQGRLRIARGQVDGMIDTLNRSIRFAAAQGWTVIYVVNGFDLLDPNNLLRNFATLAGSRGAQMDPRIVRLPGAPVFAKKVPDAFTNPALASELDPERVGRVVIGGVFADACVTATALAAQRRGLQVGVLADAIGAASDADRARALSKLRRRGIAVLPATALPQWTMATAPQG
jgi:nicotinamidase-related amidase